MALTVYQPVFFKASSPFTVSSSAHVFNSVVSNGIIPSDWKSARVTPIFKADSKVDPANYGSISILSDIAKLFEKAISIRYINTWTTIIYSLNFNLGVDRYTLP